MNCPLTMGAMEAQNFISAVHYDSATAYVTFADNLTDATNSYLLAVEVCCHHHVFVKIFPVFLFVCVCLDSEL